VERVWKLSLRRSQRSGRPHRSCCWIRALGPRGAPRQECLALRGEQPGACCAVGCPKSDCSLGALGFGCCCVARIHRRHLCWLPLHDDYCLAPQSRSPATAETRVYLVNLAPAGDVAAAFAAQRSPEVVRGVGDVCWNECTLGRVCGPTPAIIHAASVFVYQGDRWALRLCEEILFLLIKTHNVGVLCSL
jgi:hypothetical protein